MARTAQQVFDHVVESLRSQGCKSITTTGTNCMYRGPNGTKCAAGHLIPDELYNPDMEHQSISENYPSARVFSSFQKCEDIVNHSWLVRKLQEVHDEREFCDWEDSWKQLASEFGLKYTEPLVTV